MGNESRWSDERVEEIMGNLLRAGVILAAIVVLAGGIYYLIRYGTTSPDYRVFRGEPADLRSVSGILIDVTELHSRGLIPHATNNKKELARLPIPRSPCECSTQHELTHSGE